MKTHLTALSCLFLMAWSPAAAQATGTLRVRVTTPEGAPIWGATVSVKSDTGRYWSGGRPTTERGEITRTLPTGSFHLSAHASGFRSRADSFALAGNDTASRDVILTPDRHSVVAGLHLGGPARASLSLGRMYLIHPALGPDANPDKVGFLFATVEPSHKAARLSFGYLGITGNLGTGWSVRGTILQRWSPTNDLYVGTEVGGLMFGMGPRIGVFRPIRGADSRSLVIFWDFSIGV
jgi:hypothetical protein